MSSCLTYYINYLIFPSIQDALAIDVKFNNGPLTEEKKPEQKKRRYIKIDLEQKLLEETEHKKEVDEQRYKRLMHLLNKSQFYSSYILTKIEKSMDKENVKKKKNKVAVNNENKAPQTKRKRKIVERRDVEKYDIKKYIPADVSNKIFMFIFIYI